MGVNSNNFRANHKVVGATLLNEEYRLFADLAAKSGKSMSRLATELLREKIAMEPAQ